MPSRRGDMGLARALDRRLLPLVVAAMTFLAALALASSIGAAALAHRWQDGAAAVLTVQVPRSTAAATDLPAQPRLERVLALLRATTGIASARALDEAELSELLRPWLGAGAGRLALPLPAVIEVHLSGPATDFTALSQALEAVAPGTTAESHGAWVRRLSRLATSLMACAWIALGLVASIAASMIALATRAGLAARRDAIEVVHGLGATDALIAGRFAGQAVRMAAGGAAIGALAALPVLLGLADLAATFAPPASPQPDAGPALLRALPLALWLALPALPIAAGLIGWATTQATVRRWLRQLP